MYPLIAIAVALTLSTPRRIKDILYTPVGYEGGDLYLDFYLPSGHVTASYSGVCAVFAHGGLWQSGGKDDSTTVQFGMNLAATGVPTAAINYRLTSDSTCCSTDHTCDKEKCNGSCGGLYPDFVKDTKVAFKFLENEGNLPHKFKCKSFVCLGHSAGGQICGKILVEDSVAKLDGVVGIEGIYNLSKFYGGPKGEGWQCSVEKGFGSDGSLWCANGDVTCSPDLSSLPQIKSLFIHSPQDSLVLSQQAQELVCRLNGVTPAECSCDDYDTCDCLAACLGSSNTSSQYSSRVSGTHFGVLNTTQLADIIFEFVNNKCID